MATPNPLYYINDRTGRGLRRALDGRDYVEYQSYSGIDIYAAVYLPLLSRTYRDSNDQQRLFADGGVAPTSKFKVFGNLQTISISSTRSVHPVRRLGRSNPVHFTRGPRTFAGSMVFATLHTDTFTDLYDVSIDESNVNATSSMVADQLPPFSIIISASNEKGAVAVQAIHGITLMNYGTTYSVDDLYTEQVFSYVATDVTPLRANNLKVASDNIRSATRNIGSRIKTVGDLIGESMSVAYGTVEETHNRLSRLNIVEPFNQALGAIAEERGVSLRYLQRINEEINAVENQIATELSSIDPDNRRLDLLRDELNELIRQRDQAGLESGT